MSTEAQKQGVIVILGMHNSGTSMLAGMLDALNICLDGNLLRRGRAENAAAYDYNEDAVIASVQEHLLWRLDRHWRSPTGSLVIAPDAWSSPPVRAARDRLAEVLRQRVAAAAGTWGFKDPRTARLLPMWPEIFRRAGVTPRYVVALRDPAATAASFAAKAGIPHDWADALWCRHYIEILRGTRGLARRVIDYEGWWTQPDRTLARLAEALGVAPTEAARRVPRADLPRAEPQGAASPLATELYGLLRREAGGENIAAEVEDLLGRLDRPRPRSTPIEPGLARDDPGPVLAEARPLRVCIVTAELAGPTRNGGIGTAAAGLATTLAETGQAVTVLHVRGAVGPWVEQYRRAGIAIEILSPDLLPPSRGPAGVAYAVFRWLRERAFDVVHYHDWLGVGFYLATAKRSGLAFAATTLCCTVHGPSRWTRQGNGGPDEVTPLDRMEAASIEGADVVVCPSRHMRDWLAAHGVSLPPRAWVQQNLLGPVAPAPSREPVIPRELVFFGRLEARKGVTLFCDALALLGRVDVEVTFLGANTATIDGDAAAHVRRRAEALGQRWRIIDDLGGAAAQAYLRGAGRVAVIPSLIENSPYTVLECLVQGIPLLASAVGGIPELVAAEDHATALFEPTPHALAERIAGILRDGLRPARPRVDPLDTRAAWVAWHDRLPRTAEAAEPWPVPAARHGRCEVLAAGVAPARPSFAEVAAGRHSGLALPADAALLGLWAHVRSVAATDVVRLRLTDPQGRAVVAVDKPIGAAGELLVFEGRPAAPQGWAVGRYWAEWTVTSPDCGWSASLSRWIEVTPASR